MYAYIIHVACQDQACTCMTTRVIPEFPLRQLPQCSLWSIVINRSIPQIAHVMPFLMLVFADGSVMTTVQAPNVVDSSKQFVAYTTFPIHCSITLCILELCTATGRSGTYLHISLGSERTGFR